MESGDYIYTIDLLISMKKYDKTISQCNKLIDKEPDNDIAYYKKGVILANLKKYNEAVACFDNAIELNPYFTLIDIKNGISGSINYIKKNDKR